MLSLRGISRACVKSRNERLPDSDRRSLETHHPTVLHALLDNLPKIIEMGITWVTFSSISFVLSYNPKEQPTFKPYGSDADLGLVEVFGLQTERIHVSLRSTPRWILRQKRRMRIDLDGRVLL